MIDFKEARERAFELVVNTRIIEKVSEEIKNATGGTVLKEHWRVIVEIPVEEGIRELTLEINLKADFPLSLPTIKLTESDYGETKISSTCRY